jgi:LacI family transcriptional regulator
VLEERRLLDHIQVITTDLFPELIPLLESGKILATLYQRPFTQGKVAFETLTQFLVDGVRPDEFTRLAPHIVLRSNLHLFSGRLALQSDTIMGSREHESSG